MIMEKETKMLATMILEVVNTTQMWISKPDIKTKNLIEEYMESNKSYELITNEDGDSEKRFVGFYDEKLNDILKHLKTSIERDEKDQELYNSKVYQKGESQLNLVNKMVKHYADLEEEL